MSVWEEGHPPGELLSAQADGELTDDEEREVALHLAGCRVCAAELSALTVVRAAVRSMPAPELGPEFEEELIVRTRLAGQQEDAAAVQAPPQAGRRDNVISLRRRVAVAAVGVAASVGVLAVVVTPNDKSTTPQVGHMVQSHGAVSAAFDPTQLAPVAVPAGFKAP